MQNLYTQILNNPIKYRQFSCKDNLITLYNCPIKNKYEDIWSRHNYVVYVMEGRKIWHTAHGSYDLREGSCVFVRKGACIVEQFFDAAFCLVMFFLPDDFICDVFAKESQTPLYAPLRGKYDPIIPIDNNPKVQAFYNSMIPYFAGDNIPDKSLLELKFRELILTIADNPKNVNVTYFCTLLQEPQSVSLQKVMEENYCFNFKLGEFAQLSNRSLSAFKRDFQKKFNTTPGKWLPEKRLHHSMHLLTNMGKTVSEASFESGFENPSHFSRVFRQHFGMSPALVKQHICV